MLKSITWRRATSESFLPILLASVSVTAYSFEEKEEDEEEEEENVTAKRHAMGHAKRKERKQAGHEGHEQFTIGFAFNDDPTPMPLPFILLFSLLLLSSHFSFSLSLLCCSLVLSPSLNIFPLLCIYNFFSFSKRAQSVMT